VHWEPEPKGEIALESRGVEGNHVGAIGIASERTNLVDEPRTLEQLRRERRRAAVVRTHEVEPPPGVTCDDTRQEPEVVVDHARLDRLRGDVDQLRARLPKQEEEEEISLLVGLTLRRVAGQRDAAWRRG